MSEYSELELRIDAGREADAEELERLTRRLRSELQELDVESVEPVAGAPPPEGSKGFDALALGALVVRYGPGVVRNLVGAIRSWVARDAGRTVTLRDGDAELVLSGATAEQQQQLVDEFIRRLEARR